MAQLVRAPPCHGGGRGFESHSGRLTDYSVFGIIAQLGEHLPYKQRVIGSSPIGPISTEDNDRTLLHGVENVRRICDADAHITARWRRKKY